MFNEKRRWQTAKAKVEEERKAQTRKEQKKKAEGKYDYPFRDCLACPIECFRLHCFVLMLLFYIITTKYVSDVDFTNNKCARTFRFTDLHRSHVIGWSGADPQQRNEGDRPACSHRIHVHLLTAIVWIDRAACRLKPDTIQ